MVLQIGKGSQIRTREHQHNLLAAGRREYVRYARVQLKNTISSPTWVNPEDDPEMKVCSLCRMLLKHSGTLAWSCRRCHRTVR